MVSKLLCDSFGDFGLIIKSGHNNWNAKEGLTLSCLGWILVFYNTTMKLQTAFPAGADRLDSSRVASEPSEDSTGKLEFLLISNLMRQAQTPL